LQHRFVNGAWLDRVAAIEQVQSSSRLWPRALHRRIGRAFGAIDPVHVRRGKTKKPRGGRRTLFTGPCVVETLSRSLRNRSLQPPVLFAFFRSFPLRVWFARCESVPALPVRRRGRCLLRPAAAIPLGASLDVKNGRLENPGGARVGRRGRAGKCCASAGARSRPCFRASAHGINRVRATLGRISWQRRRHAPCASIAGAHPAGDPNCR
jgi:hypothetical protein